MSAAATRKSSEQGRSRHALGMMCSHLRMEVRMACGAEGQGATRKQAVAELAELHAGACICARKQHI